MKKTLILLIFSVIISVNLKAQNLILKKGKLLIDDIEVFDYKIDVAKGWLSIYDLKTKEELIYIEESLGGIDNEHGNDYVIFKFLKQKVTVETSGYSFWIDYVKFLYRNKIFDSNGKIDDLKINLFQLQFDENLTEFYKLSFSEKLTKSKELYPFKYWRENYYEYEMEQYTQENCDAAKKIFDDLIGKLIKAGENEEKEKKIKLFEIAIKELNKLSEKEEGLIETGEREDLCKLIDKITIASGLNPTDYADGEGIADLWREW